MPVSRPCCDLPHNWNDRFLTPKTTGDLQRVFHLVTITFLRTLALARRIWNLLGMAVQLLPWLVITRSTIVKLGAARYALLGARI